MAITMQGSWTLRVKTNLSAFAQRFIVSGATTGNGTYDGVVGNAVFVTGAQWSLTVQHRPSAQIWRDSAQRLGLPAVEGGLLRFDVASNDGGLDLDYDDLVLSCSLPASQADYVVYGNVKTYSGACLFNPGRDDYLVIDPPFDIAAICTRCPPLRKVIEKLYPERLRAPTDAIPDPTPLVIPSGLPNVAVGLLFQSCELPMGDFDGIGKQAEAVEALRTTIKRVPFKPSPLKAGVTQLAHSELEAIANIRDTAIRLRYQVEPAPGLLLRFQRYGRTASDLLDGPYIGAGPRQHLGQAVTDEQGNYLFHFRQASGGAAVGDVPATLQRPDLIVQVLGAGLRVRFETAPYDNIANLRRIDICVPSVPEHTGRACLVDRADRSCAQRKRAAEAALSRKANLADSGLDLHVHAHAAHPAHATHAATGRGSFVLGGLGDHGFGRQHQ
jgi:hypothetical protein